MDLHKRYLHFSTLDISLLRTVNDRLVDNEFVLYHLIQFYNCEITREELDISKLEIYRMLLCYEYQLAFGAIESRDNKYIVPADAGKICLFCIGEIFPSQYLRSPLEILVLRDIITLQMILYCDIKSAKQYLQDFLNLNNPYMTNNSTRVMYMKILEYLLEFLHLYEFLHNGASNNEQKEELKELSFMYLEIVKSWIKIKEDSEWSLFASMLPKLVEIFAPEYILYPLWDYILNDISDLKESLIILSIMANICFISSQVVDTTYIHHDIYNKSTFWLLILKGLQSPLQQYRKQALYIMKKATNSMSDFVQKSVIDLRLTKAEITPFVCSRSTDTNLSIDYVKYKFFLIYEALEEKQYHLVAPALTHLTSLINFNEEHKSYNDCFNVVWLQCILEKVLKHKNNKVVKWGVSCICKLDEIVFDDRFLELFVNILNNSCLYECQPNEECPEIVRELTALLRRMEETNLLNRFLKKINQVAWGPVAIFYIIHVLRIVPNEEIQYNNWQITELNVIKSLVETNLSKHSQILRIASQIELLRAIPNYVHKVDNMILLANTLATFPYGEGLTRGTVPWNIVTMWLKKILTKEVAVAFVENTCMKYLCEDIDPEVNPKTFALMVYLLHDANLILSCKPCATEKAIYNWMCNFASIRLRPYVEIKSCVDVAEFISHLLNLSATEHSNNVISLISYYVHNTFEFFIKNMKTMTVNLTYEDYTRYTALISSHIVNAIPFVSRRDLNTYAETLQNKSIDLLRNIKKHQYMQYLYGLHMVYLSQNISVSPLAHNLYMEYLLDTQANPVNITNNTDVINLKGKIASEYYLLVSKLMYQYVIKIPTRSWIHPATLLSKLLQCLELGTIKIVSEVAMVLTIIVDNKIINDENREIFECTFMQSWKHTMNSNKNNIFWTALQNLMGVIINDDFLSLPNAINFITEFVNQLIEEGDSTPRFKRILLSKMEKLNECNLLKLEKWLLSCLLHGSVLRRDQKIENHAHLFIAKHLGQYYPKHILACDRNNDTAVRAQAIVLLYKMINHPELNYATTIVSFIFETLKNYKHKRYFNDSFLHKLKHRSMQILLISEPVLCEESIVVLQEKLCDLIFSESDQPSVKLMLEWLMIRIIKKNLNLHDKLLNFFAESIKKRPLCTISVASIVYHVAQLLPNDSQKDLIQRALPYIAQCCLGQQFNIRFYNQFILVKLCEIMIKTNGDDSISEYKGIYQAAVASLQQESLTKNSIRMQDNFYFSSFHPIYDYSLQTIYYELPRLTDVSCDEWISPDVFKAFTFEENDNHPLKFYNINSFLSENKTSIYLTKSLADDTESLASNVETYLEGLHDIQKKIDPSRSTAPLYNNIFEAMKESIYQQDFRLHEEGLIIVASFVSRLPNLGGIARTCEIFGVKALVIANLDYVKDKEFQSLSVSAEKWINMLQVKPHELQKYLLEKKNIGWSLIGVEQTANSINLLETKFKKKTILILGNEKDGIPANFIPLFDMCVEIPQAGVIRSLNVHVTAAICIWQYATQHILK